MHLPFLSYWTAFVNVCMQMLICIIEGAEILIQI